MVVGHVAAARQTPTRVKHQVSIDTLNHVTHVYVAVDLYVRSFCACGCLLYRLSFLTAAAATLAPNRPHGLIRLGPQTRSVLISD